MLKGGGRYMRGKQQQQGNKAGDMAHQNTLVFAPRPDSYISGQRKMTIGRQSWPSRK
jgi:hypothetical protein